MKLRSIKRFVVLALVGLMFVGFTGCGGGGGDNGSASADGGPQRGGAAAEE